MSVFRDITDKMLQKEFNILKNLERQVLPSKNKNLERIRLNPAKEKRHFSAHPKRICSDSDTSPATSPRLEKFCSLSDLDLSLSCMGHSVYQEKKEKPHQPVHRKLHEKLSLIDRHQSDRSELSEIGDGFMVHSDNVEKFKKNIHQYDSSSESSLVLDHVEDNIPCKAYQNIQKQTTNPSTVSVVSKRTNSRFSTAQNSFASKGMPTSVFEKKYRIICERALQSINDIRILLTKGTPTPDGDEDMNRRETRVKEFANRFSRNYLYPLVKQIENLSQPSHPLPLINQKMLSAYQYVLHGLQAYQSHLPTSIGECCAHQFRVMLTSLVDLCEIHRRHVDNEEEYVLEFIDTFKINAELTIQKIDEFLNNRVKSDDLKIENLEALTKNLASNKKRIESGKSTNKKNSVDKRFAMYTVTAAFRKDANWKKAVESLAKKKFNVKSKYRTASYKHRPPVQKEPEILSLPKFPFYGPAKKSGLLKNSPVGPRINEDRITTMVQVEREGGNYKEDGEEHNKGQPQGNKEELLLKLLQWTLKNHQNDSKDNQKTDLNDILNLVKEEESADFLKKVLDGLKDEQCGGDGDAQQLTLEIVKSHTSLGSEDGSRPKSQRKEPKITISGEKNVRLVCITDENSVIEPCSEDEEEKVETKNTNCQTEAPKLEPKPKIIIRTSSETQTDVKTHDINEAVTKATQKGKTPTNVKISRLKRTGRPLQQLQKKYAVDIIQYKLDFYRHCKNNPMYKRTTNCQPCILMGKISEDIFNECLLEIAREIEVNDIAEKVYKAELTL